MQRQAGANGAGAEVRNGDRVRDRDLGNDAQVHDGNLWGEGGREGMRTAPALPAAEVQVHQMHCGYTIDIASTCPVGVGAQDGKLCCGASGMVKRTFMRSSLSCWHDSMIL